MAQRLAGVEKSRLIYGAAGACLGALAGLHASQWVSQADPKHLAIAGGLLGAWGGVLFEIAFILALVGAAAGWFGAVFGYVALLQWRHETTSEATPWIALYLGSLAAVFGAAVGVWLSIVLSRWRRQAGSVNHSDDSERKAQRRQR
jgi:MFS family permease